MPNALSEQEDAFLRQGGAAGVGGYNKLSAAENVAIIAGEYAQMVATSYSQRALPRRPIFHRELKDPVLANILTETGKKFATN